MSSNLSSKDGCARAAPWAMRSGGKRSRVRVSGSCISRLFRKAITRVACVFGENASVSDGRKFEAYDAAYPSLASILRSSITFPHGGVANTDGSIA